MAVVYVIATDWTMRTAVRAELREMGVDALGMNSAEDVRHAFASNALPNAVVLEATPELIGDSLIRSLIRRVPAVLIASRTIDVPLPDVTAIFYRPVSIADIVVRVNEILAQDH